MSLNAPNHFQYRRGLSSSSAPHVFRSAPTQNARPSPVMTTTRMSSSQLCELHARLREAALVRVLAGRHELLAPGPALERVLVGELPLGVVRMCGLTHRRSSHFAVSEHRIRDLLAHLDVLGVRILVR